MVRLVAATAVLWTSGCIDAAPVDPFAGPIPFTPEAASPDDVWLVTWFETDLACPDGEPSRLATIHPASSDGPLPTAVVYHSGSFDHVFAPDPQEPLDGPHFASPNRLDSAWATRHVQATLGMFPPLLDAERHDGALVAGLARRGRAVVMPTNCWGDLWGARSGGQDSDVALDFFRREGSAAAELAYLSLVDRGVAGAIGVDLPFEVSTDEVVAIGLGEGGRAVMELLSVDRDGAPGPDYALAGALVDTPPDDLGVLVADPSRFGAELQGLRRIFPRYETDPSVLQRGSLAGPSDLPAPFVYVVSGGASNWPTAVHDMARERLANTPGAVVLDADVTGNIATNGASAELTEQVLDLLTP